MGNIIDAIITLVENPVTEIVQHYKSTNRANNMGESLEEYIKDLFAGTVNTKNESDRLSVQEDTFSYKGNQNNPPDSMLKGGDAIEVKKIERIGSVLALNSSYPKAKLFSNSHMITDACRDAEDWTEKDLIYAVGVVKDNKLHALTFVYGIDYAASASVYEKIKNTIRDGVHSIPNVEFAETKELGHVNRVDPLGITYLRVRGMWGIENPFTVFKYIYKPNTTKKFNFMAIINKEKYATFLNNYKLEALVKINPNLTISDEKIKNPDNPAKLKNVKLITFSL